MAIDKEPMSSNLKIRILLCVLNTEHVIKIVSMQVVFDAINTNSDCKISLEEWTHAWLSFVFVSGPECPFSLFYGQLVD